MATKLKKTQKHAQEVDAKLQKAIQAVKECGIESFSLSFWKDGDPTSHIFSSTVEHMKPGHFFNLSVLVLENAAKTWADSAGPQTPREFGGALSLFQADLAEAVKTLQGRIMAMKKK